MTTAKKRRIKTHIKRHKHGKYFCVTSIRVIALLSVFTLLVLGNAAYQKLSSSQRVLGAQTSIYNQQCAWWNIFCHFQFFFHINVTTSPLTTTTIDTNQIMQGDNNQNALATPTPTLPTSTPIAGYLYYVDPQYLFSLQYPQGLIRTAYSQLPTDHSVIFQGNQTIQFRILTDIFDISGNPTNLEDYVKKVIIPTDLRAKTHPETVKIYTQTFGPNSAVVVEGLTDGKTAFLFREQTPNDALIFAISAVRFVDDTTFANVVASIRVKTFSITPAPTIAATNFLVWTDNTFHFSIEYPQGTYPSQYLPSNDTGSWNQNSISTLMLNTLVALFPYSKGTIEQQHSVVFSGNNIQPVSVLLGRNTTGLSLEEFTKQDIVPNQPYLNRENISVYTKTFGSHAGVVAENLTDTRGTTVFFQNGTLVFSISLGTKGSLSNLPTLYTIASSLDY